MVDKGNRQNLDPLTSSGHRLPRRSVSLAELRSVTRSVCHR